MSQPKQREARSPFVAACFLVPAIRVAVDFVQGQSVTAADVLAAVGFLLLLPSVYFKPFVWSRPAKPGAWSPSGRSLELLAGFGGLCFVPALLLMFIE